MSDVNLDQPDATDDAACPAPRRTAEPETAPQVASFAELAEQTHTAAVLDVTAAAGARRSTTSRCTSR